MAKLSEILQFCGYFFAFFCSKYIKSVAIDAKRFSPRVKLLNPEFKKELRISNLYINPAEALFSELQACSDGEYF